VTNVHKVFANYKENATGDAYYKARVFANLDWERDFVRKYM